MNWIKSTYLVFPALVLSLFISCSNNPASFGSENIEAVTENKGITVINKRGESVYFFAVESEYAERIFWVPKSSQENRIKAYSNKRISYSDIGGFEKGDKIIFYYWSAEDPAKEDIQNFVIQTK